MKKTLTTILLLPLALLPCRAQTNVIFGYMADLQLTPTAGTAVTMSLISPSPKLVNGIWVSPQPITHYTDAKGFYSFKNVPWGEYEWDCAGQSLIGYVGLNTTGSNNVITLTTNTYAFVVNGQAYSAAAGQGITIATNGSVLTFSSTGLTNLSYCDAVFYPDAAHTVDLTTNDNLNIPHTTRLAFTNSLTCGMQEVDNLFTLNTYSNQPAAYGKFHFLAGTYVCKTNIVFQNWWGLEGQGLIKTVILDASPTNNNSLANLCSTPWNGAFIQFMPVVPNEVIWWLLPQAQIFDLTIKLATNTPKALLFGVFDGGEIARVGFGGFDYLNNNACGKQGFSYLPTTREYYPVAAYLQTANVVSVHNCTFSGLADGMWSSGQTVGFHEYDNIGAGLYASTNFPKNSLLRFGALAVVDNLGYASFDQSYSASGPSWFNLIQSSPCELGPDQLATSGTPYVINANGVKVNIGFFEKVDYAPLVYWQSPPVDFYNSGSVYSQITYPSVGYNDVFSTITNDDSGNFAVDRTGNNDNGSFWFNKQDGVIGATTAGPVAGAVLGFTNQTALEFGYNQSVAWGLYGQDAEGRGFNGQPAFRIWTPNVLCANGAGVTNIPAASIVGLGNMATVNSNSVLTWITNSSSGGGASTNGLASIIYVNTATNTLWAASTNYVHAATNGLVGTSITNGLVGPSITNGTASISYVAGQLASIPAANINASVLPTTAAAFNVLGGTASGLLDSGGGVQVSGGTNLTATGTVLANRIAGANATLTNLTAVSNAYFTAGVYVTNGGVNYFTRTNYNAPTASYEDSSGNGKLGGVVLSNNSVGSAATVFYGTWNFTTNNNSILTNTVVGWLTNTVNSLKIPVCQ